MWNEKCAFARKDFTRKDLRGRSKEEGVRRNVKEREIAWNVEGGMWNEKCAFARKE